MSLMIRCAHCRSLFRPDPRVKNQRYCGKKACQRARKNLWQRQKMADDPDYKENQRDCHRSWLRHNPGYWRRYRSQHPEYVQRNRLLQKDRNTRRSPPGEIAKMDESEPFSSVKPGTY
ncbi:MAG: hypothetical protein GTO24_24765 [candidate division Zixibacteria bacterium]|nr:hypothetical protein [candidate division Zixibacteria bacterium]